MLLCYYVFKRYSVFQKMLVGMSTDLRPWEARIMTMPSPVRLYFFDGLKITS